MLGMKYLLIFAAFLAWGQSDSPEEIVPGFIVTPYLETEAGSFKVGDGQAQVMQALGPAAKVDKRPKRYSSGKLMSEARMLEQLMPTMRWAADSSRGLAAECGAECWVSLARLKVGKSDEIRVTLFGLDPAQLAARTIVYDRNRSAISAWRRQTLEDLATSARYFLTDDKTIRVSRRGNVLRVERLPR